MKAYIINLKQADDRKLYMQQQFPLLPSSLSFEFIEAVDGRTLSIDDRNDLFNTSLFRSRYNYDVRPGEIGCTLSHQKCYHKLVESDEKSVLILEDDIVVRQDISSLLTQVEELLNTERPRIILLSGWYWYLGKKKIEEKHQLASVYDALLTHAYAINRAAALLLIEQRPCFLADDWFYIRKKGVKLDALLPHVLNQKWNNEFPSSVNTEKIKIYHVPLKRKIMRSLHFKILDLLRFAGHYEIK